MANVYDSVAVADDEPNGKGNVYDALPTDDDAPKPEPEKPAPRDPKLQSLGFYNTPLGDAVRDNIQAMGSGAYHSVIGGYKGLGTLIATHDINRAADSVTDETAKAYQAPESAVKSAIESKYNPLNYVQELADYSADKSSDAGWSPAIATAIKSLPTALPAVTGIAGLRIPKTVRAARAESAANAAADGDRLSIGAAHTAPDISGLPPEYRQAFADASDKGPVDLGAHARHADALTLPMPEGEKPPMLTKGQATRNGAQISDEDFMSSSPETQGLLAANKDHNNKALGLSIGEIQRRATPTVVQRLNAEHGQTAVDRIKNFDNGLVLDTRAKYKALEDANGGTMPIDTGTLVDNIDGQLKKKFLSSTAEDNKGINEILSALRSKTPIDFEQFEDMRTNLAAIQREGARPAKAAAIVRNALENMPLTPEAAKLKDMADAARASAKRRYDITESNPAYEAAINDNVPKDNNGLHRIGADSPLAESFMNKFFLGDTPNASRAYIQRLKGLIPDPELHQAIEGATLNKLREAAAIDPNGEGIFATKAYDKARRGIEPKADALLSPEAAENTEHLRRVANDINFTDKSTVINRSGTAKVLERMGALPPTAPPTAVGELAHHAADAVIHSTLGPAGNVAKSVGMGILKRSRDAKAAKAAADAKLKFAIDATKPGAGLEADPTRPARASGGRVPDVDALVDRLVNRWKAVKRETDAGTKPLLAVPDEAIVKALAVAKQAV